MISQGPHIAPEKRVPEKRVPSAYVSIREHTSAYVIILEKLVPRIEGRSPI